MLLVKQRLAEIQTMDNILQPPLKLQDDWYQSFDKIRTLSLLEQAEITCELLYVNRANRAFRTELVCLTFLLFSFILCGFSHSSIPG